MVKSNCAFQKQNGAPVCLLEYLCRLVTLNTESEIIHDLIHQRAAQRNFLCMPHRNVYLGPLSIFDSVESKSLKDSATHNNSLERSL